MEEVTITVVSISTPEHPLIPEIGALYSAHGSRGVVSPGDVVFKATQGERLVGVVRLCHENRTLLLRGMHVLTELQGQRIGQKLLQSFDAHLRDGKLGPVYCLSYVHLERFYGKIGFRAVVENRLPEFLKQRLGGYRQTYTSSRFIGMLRE